MGKEIMDTPPDPEPNPTYVWETARSGLGFGSLATVGSTPTFQTKGALK